MKENPAIQPLITRNDRIRAYASFPGLLEEIVVGLFAGVSTPEQIALHNVSVMALRQIATTEEQWYVMCKNVARAIIRTVTSEGAAPDGQCAS